MCGVGILIYHCPRLSTEIEDIVRLVYIRKLHKYHKYNGKIKKSSAIADNRWQTARCWFVKLLIEVWKDFLSEYVDKKFTYICYRRLIRHEWLYYGSKNCVIYNSYKIV